MMIKFDKKFNVIYKHGENKIPIMLWLDKVEKGAFEQMSHLSLLPFTFHHVAGMPDMHQGYGMPIGGVMAADGYIIPNAVGKDIGCGICVIRTNLFVGSLNKTVLKRIMRDVRKLIPIGVGGKHKKSQEGMPKLSDIKEFSIENHLVMNYEWGNASKQLGTLGSGNHFIEIQEGSDGYIWIMIHSGSRNLGSKVCDYYNKIATQLNEKWYSSVPKSWGLSFLPFHSEEGQMYFYEMNFCCNFALANRKTMIDRIKEAFHNNSNVEFDEESFINIHHNYAAMENHYGRNVLVHRKGATRAYKGEYGIIPGSQGTNSYIVIGKGNKLSFKSCSHGAGRVLSRADAKRKLKLANEIEKLDKQNIVHAIRTKNDLEEAPGAYKNILDVIDHQKDLVDIDVTLKPIAVLKG